MISSSSTLYSLISWVQTEPAVYQALGDLQDLLSDIAGVPDNSNLTSEEWGHDALMFPGG
jgi:hypothetical protein